MARNPSRKLLDITKDGWRPYASAPFGPFTDDDDGTVEFGFQDTRGSAISVMRGWDFYFSEPTHWRPSNSDAVGQSDGVSNASR